ncbi:MAG TPA: 50S ribosomal protein L22 [Cytophagaceae bacterium]
MKRQKKEADKLAKKTGPVTAKLVNVPTSNRKMRLVADLIRGQKVNQVLGILKFQQKQGAPRLEKLVLSAISDWQAKNADIRLEEADLFIKEIFVDGGRMLKRLRPAPQGRAHRVRKRSNHVTLTLASSVALGTSVQATQVIAEPVAESTPKVAPKTTAKKATAEPKKSTKKTDNK